jgi:hypothetical protein
VLAEYATGMMDAPTERMVQAALEEYPDLRAQAQALGIVRNKLSRAAYNSHVDARAMKAVHTLKPKPRRLLRLWLGSTAAVVAIAAVLLLVLLPLGESYDGDDQAGMEYDQHSEMSYEIYTVLAEEINEAKLFALAGEDNLENLVFLTEQDLNFLLDESHDAK